MDILIVGAVLWLVAFSVYLAVGSRWLRERDAASE